MLNKRTLSMYHPTYTLCDAPFMTYINPYMLQEWLKPWSAKTHKIYNH
jgi:hypothetical protein